MIGELWEIFQKEIEEVYSRCTNVTEFIFSDNDDHLSAAFWTGDFLFIFFIWDNFDCYSINVTPASNCDGDLFCDGFEVKKEDLVSNVENLSKALVTLMTLKYGLTNRYREVEEAIIALAKRIPSKISYECNIASLVPLDHPEYRIGFFTEIILYKDWSVVVEKEGLIFDFDDLAKDLMNHMKSDRKDVVNVHLAELSIEVPSRIIDLTSENLTKVDFDFLTKVRSIPVELFDALYDDGSWVSFNSFGRSSIDTRPSEHELFRIRPDLLEGR